MYKVHFTLKGEEYELVAGSLDLTHPYFVSIKDLKLDYEEGPVVNPRLENTKKRFRNIGNLMIPFQNCALIESVPEKSRHSADGSSVKVLKLNVEDTDDQET